MNRCSFREWIPILPWPVWPLAGQCLLGQKTVVGSMRILLLAVRGNIARRSMSGPRFLYNFTTPRLGVELPRVRQFYRYRHVPIYKDCQDIVWLRFRSIIGVRKEELFQCLPCLPIPEVCRMKVMNEVEMGKGFQVVVTNQKRGLVGRVLGRYPHPAR